jgi:hypothetical protein
MEKALDRMFDIEGQMRLGHGGCLARRAVSLKVVYPTGLRFAMTLDNPGSSYVSPDSTIIIVWGNPSL